MMMMMMMMMMNGHRQNGIVGRSHQSHRKGRQDACANRRQMAAARFWLAAGWLAGSEDHAGTLLLLGLDGAREDAPNARAKHNGEGSKKGSDIESRTRTHHSPSWAWARRCAGEGAPT
jgi:hypothetical protein